MNTLAKLSLFSFGPALTLRGVARLAAAAALVALPAFATGCGAAPEDGGLSAAEQDLNAQQPGILSAGMWHGCSVSTADATAYCWGENGYGKVGTGTTGGVVKSPSQVRDGQAALQGVKAVATGKDHSCALLAGGAVRCWGSNQYGQLGRVGPNAPLPAAPAIASGAVALSAGDLSTCALMADGTVLCWGANSSGQLGDGTTIAHTLPAPVQWQPGGNLTGVTGLSVGSAHACALLSNGAPFCWGANGKGQVGNGTTGSTTPVTVATRTTAVHRYLSIAAGGSHTCAVNSSGGVDCWGYGNSGQLGDGRCGTVMSGTPVPAVALASGSPLSGQVSVVAGDLHTCALSASGEVSCWGYNADGQLGLGFTSNACHYSTVPDTTEARPVPSLSASTLAAGYRFTCARGTDGLTRCWGMDGYAQLGNGTTASAFSSPQVLSLAP